MPRKPVIAANWKMYKIPTQAREFVEKFLPLVSEETRSQIVLCPSATSLATVVAAVKDTEIAVGGQNMHYAEEGAYTGETSPLMLRAVGRHPCHYWPFGAAAVLRRDRRDG